jgi:hypothetical protein
VCCVLCVLPDCAVRLRQQLSSLCPVLSCVSSRVPAWCMVRRCACACWSASVVCGLWSAPHRCGLKNHFLDFSRHMWPPRAVSIVIVIVHPPSLRPTGRADRKSSGTIKSSTCAAPCACLITHYLGRTKAPPRERAMRGSHLSEIAPPALHRPCTSQQPTHCDSPMAALPHCGCL